MIKGGYILVDDVKDNNKYDGISLIWNLLRKKIKPVIIGNKCGLIKKE